MLASNALLERLDSRDHLVQMYEADEQALVRNVARYLLEGLALGSLLIVVTTPEHEAAFCQALEAGGADPQAAAGDGRLTILNAEATLARFMVDGYPDADLFEQTVGVVVRQAAERAGDHGVRAFGEMVGVLWASKQYPAAIRLEQLWHKLMKSVEFNLFCGYPIDIFAREFNLGVVDALLCAHTHLVPTGRNADLEAALTQATNDVLGARLAGLKPLMKRNFRPAWAALPNGEAMILWLRNNLPDRADEILDRARAYYNATV